MKLAIALKKGVVFVLVVAGLMSLHVVNCSYDDEREYARIIEDERRKEKQNPGFFPEHEPWDKHASRKNLAELSAKYDQILAKEAKMRAEAKIAEEAQARAEKDAEDAVYGAHLWKERKLIESLVVQDDSLSVSTHLSLPENDNAILGQRFLNNLLLLARSAPMVETIIKSPKFGVNGRDGDSAPLHEQNLTLQVAQLLIEHGANPCWKNKGHDYWSSASLPYQVKHDEPGVQEYLKQEYDKRMALGK